MRKLICVLFLSVMICSLAIAKVGGELPRSPGGTPIGVRDVTIDVSCFLEDTPVPSRVTIRKIDSQGNPISPGSSLWSQDGRVRFTGIKTGKSYYINAVNVAGPGLITSTTDPTAAKRLSRITESQATWLALQPFEKPADIRPFER